MLKPILVSIVAAVPFSLSAMPVPAPVPCTEVVPHAPLVVYDVSGGTLAGLIDIGLTVYNDGWVRASSWTQATGANKSDVAYVGPAVVAQLVRDLAQGGGGVLCDQVSFANDLPTQTLTILRDATDTKGHTYSWVEGNPNYWLVEQRMQAFFAATFPNF